MSWPFCQGKLSSLSFINLPGKLVLLMTCSLLDWLYRFLHVIIVFAMAFVLWGSVPKLPTTNKYLCVQFFSEVKCWRSLFSLIPGWKRRNHPHLLGEPCPSHECVRTHLVSSCIQHHPGPLPVSCSMLESGKAESKDNQGQRKHPASQVTAEPQQGSTPSPGPPSLSPLPKPQGY